MAEMPVPRSVEQQEPNSRTRARTYLWTCLLIAPIVNATCLWVALALDARHVHDFGYIFVAIAVPANILALVALGLRAQQRPAPIVAAIAADAAMSFLFVIV